MKAEILHGDCKELLKSIPDNSLDSLLTDPPYELSNAHQASPERVLTEVLLVEHPKIEAHLARHDVLPHLVAQVLHLCRGGGLPRPSSAVPEGSMAFDDDASGWKYDVVHAQVGAVGSADGDLGQDVEPESAVYLGRFLLELADGGDESLCDQLRHAGCGSTTSGFRVGFRVGPSGLDGLLRCDPSVVLRSDRVGLSHHALADLVGAEVRAGEAPMSCALSLGGAPEERLPADRALVLLAALQLGGAKLVAARTGAGGLPAVLQAVRVSVVAPTADRTLSFDLITHARTKSGSGGFMNQGWDATGIAFDVDLWREVYRVLKPGAHGAVFGADRKMHRVTCALEDAGFEVRAGGAWISAQVFPKSLDASKALDRASGVSPAHWAEWLRKEREKAGRTREWVAEQVGCTVASVRDWEEGRSRATGQPVEHILPSPPYRKKLIELFGGYAEDMRLIEGVTTDRRDDGTVYGLGHSGLVYGDATTAAALRWAGWGTALKTLEPWVLIRKPMEGTLAENLMKWGVGALNIDGCRLPLNEPRSLVVRDHASGADPNLVYGAGLSGSKNVGLTDVGRWPSMLICSDLDIEGPALGVEVFGAEDDDLDGVLGPYTKHFRIGDQIVTAIDDEIFGRILPTWVVCPKVGVAERELGCDELVAAWVDASRKEGSAGRENPRAGAGRKSKRKNIHPTVKPISLLRHITRMITPPGGRVLDTFAGSGSGGMAAVWEGMDYIGMELTNTDEQPFLQIGQARLAYAMRTPAPPIEARVVRPKEKPASPQLSLF